MVDFCPHRQIFKDRRGRQSHRIQQKSHLSMCILANNNTSPGGFSQTLRPSKAGITTASHQLPMIRARDAAQQPPCGSRNGLILDSEFAASYRCCCGCRIAVKLRPVLMDICPCKTFVQGRHSVFVFQPHQGLHPGESNRWSSFPQPCPDNVGIPFFGHRSGFVFFS